jgi:hypothetical protein
LEGRGKFSAGTFIASSSLSPAAKTAVPAPAGLEYSDEGAKRHSVRGILWSHGALYVADQPAGRIKVFDRDGKYLRQSNPVETPVHLVVNGNELFVSGANEVLQGDLTGEAGNLRLTAVPGLHVKNGGGMAFSSSDRFGSILRQVAEKPASRKSDIPLVRDEIGRWQVYGEADYLAG